MAIVLELPADVETKLQNYAAREGTSVAELLRHAAEEIAAKAVPKRWTAVELLKLPLAERQPILERLFDAAAPLYDAGLALPPMERELTAFTALDGVDPIRDEYDFETDDCAAD